MTALVALGCGAVDSNNPPGQGGRAGSAMGSGAAGSAGSGGAGGMSMGGSGGSQRDAGPETGSENGGSGPFMYPDGCPTPVAIPANSAQTIVIQSVNFRTSQVVIRNASPGPVAIEGGQMGWQWCNIPGYDLLVLEDITLQPDETLAFYMIQNGRVIRPLFDGEPGDPNELGIYIDAGSFDESDLIAAFVSWGAGYNGGREVTANLGEKWIFGERIEIGPGDDGFIITGKADEGAGYTSVPERCLVAPPNPPGTLLPVVGP
jgi:hypothetical protein